MGRPLLELLAASKQLTLLEILARARRAPDVLYFASGANHLGEVVGFDQIGQPYGITARSLLRQRDRDDVLKAVLRSSVPVFVDSGAFSEVAPAPPFPVVSEITDREWRQILALYERVARALGPRAYLVAPDRVGSQQVTLQRLERYAPELRKLHALGARIMLPLQPGSLPLARFEERAAKILGFLPMPAFPMKKAATSDQELRAFFSERKPERVHMLGLGIESPRWPSVRSIVLGLSP